MRPLGQSEWQRAIFAEKLNRFELISVAKPDDLLASVDILVYRNHAFELVASVLPTFFAFSGLQCNLTLSAYDDSVQAQEGAPAAEIIWIDFERYGELPTDALCDWFIERLEAVRLLSCAPMIVANSPRDAARDEQLNERLKTWSEATPAAAILDLRAIARDLGARFFDQRRRVVTGTSLSDAASLEVARALGLALLPSFFLPPIKAIALDLDHTLYSGVLGEDGPSAVLFTPSHLELQATLKILATRGVLLVVVSRNEREDVDALFEKRSDFALRSEDIASWQVSWGSKADGIRRAARGTTCRSRTHFCLSTTMPEKSARWQLKSRESNSYLRASRRSRRAQHCVDFPRFGPTRCQTLTSCGRLIFARAALGRRFARGWTQTLIFGT